MKNRDEQLRQLGERLGIARERASLTQGEAARRALMGKSSLSNYERGRVQMRSTTAKRLALVYGVSADWLLGLSETMEAEG